MGTTQNTQKMENAFKNGKKKETRGKIARKITHQSQKKNDQKCPK